MTTEEIKRRRAEIEAQARAALAVATDARDATIQQAQSLYDSAERSIATTRYAEIDRLLEQIVSGTETPPEPQPKAPDAQPTQPKRRPRVESKPEEPAQTPPKPTEVKPEEPPQPEPVAAPAGPVVLCEHHGEPVDEFGACPKCLF